MLIACALSAQSIAKPPSQSAPESSSWQGTSKITPAMPVGSPAEWVTSDDYPTEAARTATKGIVNFTLAIEDTGKVTDCSITESSGSQTLDDATCALMMARARFTPGHDERGQAVATAFHMKFRWELPNGREIWTLDQIRFPAPKDANSLQPLAGDHSMDAVVVRLKSLGIAFTRGTAQLDTSTVPAKVVEQIDRLPATEPFVIPQPGVVTISVITSRTPAEMAPTNRLPLLPLGSSQVTVSYDVDPNGKPGNCQAKGEMPAWMASMGAVCKAMEAAKPTFASDPAKQGRHVAITIQLSVTPLGPRPALPLKK